MHSAVQSSWSKAAIGAMALFVANFGYFFVTLLAFVVRQTEQTAKFEQSGSPLGDPNQILVRILVQNVTVGLLFVLPMLTMHFVRDARRHDRFGENSSASSTDIETALGRFIGAVILYSVGLAVTLVNLAVLTAYGPLQWPPILAAYLGLLLFGAGFIAVGVCVAGTTTNSVVALVATMTVFLALWVIGWLDGVSGEWAGLLRYLSPVEHFNDFAKGVLDTSHAIYYASLIAFALSLAILFRARTIAFARSAMLMLAVLVGVNYAAANYRLRWDLTETREFSLSDQSRAVLQQLNGPLRVTVFERRDGFQRFRDLLDEYAYASKFVSTAYVDPEQAPTLAHQYNVDAFGTIVLDYEGRVERVTSLAEDAVANGIVKVMGEQRRTIYFIQGHGERDIASPERTGYDQIVTAIRGQDYTVEPLILVREASVPKDAAVVIVAGPKQDYPAAEVEILQRYLDDGGRLLLELDPRDRPEDAGLSNLIGLARNWGIHVGDNIVIDVSGTGQALGSGPEVSVATSYPSHPITSGFKTITAFPISREVSPVSGGVEGRVAEPVIESNTRSWAETDLRGLLSGGNVALNEDQGDKRGPIVLGSAVTASSTRVVVFGDSDFASNLAVGAGGNRDLFLNTLAWLSTTGDQIVIPPKPAFQSGLTLTPSAQQNLMWMALVLLPGVVLVGGFLGRPTQANAQVLGWPIVGGAMSASITATKTSDQTTRLLCASVLFNHGNARNTVLEWVRDPNRAVADELGIDMKLVVQVARYAERRERRYWLIYFAISIATALIALITMSVGEITPATIAVILAGVAAGAVVFARKRIQDRNTFLPMFQLGRFGTQEVANRFRAELTTKDLSAMPAERQDFFVYAGFMPFVGAGYDLGGWSVAIALDKPKDHLGIEAAIVAFDTDQIYAAIDRDVQQLGLLNIGTKDCYFTSGADLRGDPTLLPNKFGRPVQCLSHEAAVRYVSSDNDQARHYRRYQIVDWGGELALSYYLRCLRRGNTLFVETKRFILTPVAESYREVDRTVPLNFQETMALVAGSLVVSPFLLVAAPFQVLGELSRGWHEWWGTQERARRKLIERNPLYNYGALASLRQMCGSGEYGHYFQKMDGDLFNKALEREVLDSLIAFLDEHGIETSDLKERQTTILNSGVIVHGGDVRADSLAVGAGSQAHTQVTNPRRAAKRQGAAE